MSQIEIGIHTLDINHRISRMEAKDIKTIFGIKMNEVLKTTSFHYKGINQLEITENSFPDKNGGLKNSYILKIKVNPSHMLKISKFKILPATQKNINKMTSQLTSILSNDLHLSLSNSDCGEWSIDRIDFAFDVQVYNAPIMIRILNHALKVNFKKCSRIPFKSASPEKVVYQSIRFGNQSYIYNIYDKLQQLVNGKYVLSPEEQIYFENVIRVEKQIFNKGVNNCIGTPKKLSLLQDWAIIEKVKNDMLKEFKLFFGTGNHVSHQIALKTITNSQFSKNNQNKMINIIISISKYGIDNTLDKIRTYATQYGYDMEYQLKTFYSLLQNIESLCISPAGILAQESIEINTNNLPNIIDLLPCYITTLKKTRSKLPFGKIYTDHSNTRYKCNFTFHPIDKGSDRTSYADADRDKLEDKIIHKLIKVHKTNLLYAQSNSDFILTEIIQKSKQDIINFGKIAKCPEVIQQINNELFNPTKEVHL